MLNARGHEIPDPIPVEVPIQWRRPPTLQEQIKAFVRRELSMQAAEEGHETFEEADDFDVGDDFDPSSPYEEIYDPPVDSGNVQTTIHGSPVGPASVGTGSGPAGPAGTGEGNAQAAPSAGGSAPKLGPAA